jgi:hypothetical protein
MRDNGLEICAMALGNKNGRMEQSMKENGSRTRLKAKVNLHTQMETTIKEIGRMTKQMDMEFIFIAKLELNMKATGNKICNMVQE